MGLPRVIKNFNLFGNGQNWMGIAKEVELPKLTRKMQEYRGGGMNGEVDIDLGQERMEATITFGGHMRAVLNDYASPLIDGVMLRFVAIAQADSADPYVAIEVVLRGRYKEIDMGSNKGGELADFKVTFSASYYKYAEDDETVIEIDVPNFIEKVNEVDRLKEQRQILGIAGS